MAARRPSTAVFLVGFMGAGKTSVGQSLAQRLNWSFEDLDDRIVRVSGRTVAEIFRDSGELAFRQAERTALEQVLQELQTGAVRIVALGGGAFAQAQNHQSIQASGIPTVFLDASLAELWRRCVQQSDTKRPLQTSQDTFRDIYSYRLRYYQTASLRMDTTEQNVEAIAAEIAETLGLRKMPRKKTTQRIE